MTGSGQRGTRFVEQVNHGLLAHLNQACLRPVEIRNEHYNRRKDEDH